MSDNPATAEANPVFGSKYNSAVADFAVPKQAYLAAHPDAPFGYIATSALVLDLTTTSNPQILLLQRVASDEDPNKWEPPGGACDDEDETVLHGVARELLEEAGLEAEYIDGPVGEPHFFTLDDGKKVCQFNFAVRPKHNGKASLAVLLNPEEHQQFVWATESEVKAGKAGGIDLDFTREEVKRTVLQAFDFARNFR